MKSKIFEIRDRATYIPVLATATNIDACDLVIECCHLKLANYGKYSPLIILTKINSNPLQSAYSPDEWGDRTMSTAHAYIEEHYNELPSGTVIDVQYILGETKNPVRSEVFNASGL